MITFADLFWLVPLAVYGLGAVLVDSFTWEPQ